MLGELARCWAKRLQLGGEELISLVDGRRLGARGVDNRIYLEISCARWSGIALPLIWKALGGRGGSSDLERQNL